MSPVGVPNITPGCPQCHLWVPTVPPLGTPGATCRCSKCYPWVPPISPLGASQYHPWVPPVPPLGACSATHGCPQYHPWVPPNITPGCSLPHHPLPEPLWVLLSPPSHQLSPQGDGTKGGFGVPEGLRRVHRDHVLQDWVWGNASKGDPQGVPNPIPPNPIPTEGTPQGHGGHSGVAPRVRARPRKCVTLLWSCAGTRVEKEEFPVLPGPRDGKGQAWSRGSEGEPRGSPALTSGVPGGGDPAGSPCQASRALGNKEAKQMTEKTPRALSQRAGTPRAWLEVPGLACPQRVLGRGRGAALPVLADPAPGVPRPGGDGGDGDWEGSPAVEGLRGLAPAPLAFQTHKDGQNTPFSQPCCFCPKPHAPALHPKLSFPPRTNPFLNRLNPKLIPPAGPPPAPSCSWDPPGHIPVLDPSCPSATSSSHQCHQHGPGRELPAALPFPAWTAEARPRPLQELQQGMLGLCHCSAPSWHPRPPHPCPLGARRGGTAVPCAMGGHRHLPVPGGCSCSAPFGTSGMLLAPSSPGQLGTPCSCTHGCWDPPWVLPQLHPPLPMGLGKSSWCPLPALFPPSLAPRPACGGEALRNKTIPNEIKGWQSKTGCPEFPCCISPPSFIALLRKKNPGRALGRCSHEDRAGAGGCPLPSPPLPALGILLPL